MTHHESNLYLKPERLRCEHLHDPLGIDEPHPRLSWTLDANGQNRRQTAYRILVASVPETLARGEGDLWDSGRVTDDETLLIPYAGTPLVSRQTCHWQVQVWDERGAASAWSIPARWEMGLLSDEDWAAQWIGLEPWTREDVSAPSAHLRTVFDLPADPRRARLYVTARGLYEARLNGERVGDQLLTPGWTDYNLRLQYQTYDVTAQLQRGANAFGLLLGDGWYCGAIGFRQERRHYGHHPEAFAQLEIELMDGSQTTICTSGRWGQWRAASGAIRSSDMLHGEEYDAQQELTGWDSSDYDDSIWNAVQTSGRGSARLVADRAEPVRVLEVRRPVSVTRSASGTHIFDLGQNMVGWARLRVQGDAGTTLQLRFAEILDDNGELYMESLRTARATDTFILSGRGQEVFEPRFTFHGFRFVELSGLPGEPDTGTLLGVVVGSDIPVSGTFTSSSELVNQLQSNIVWGQRGNFLSVPTDCPQRDERLGWLGDAQVFARTAAFNGDVAAFLTKWMIDVEDAQSPVGAFPDVAPRLVDGRDGAPAWGDAGVIVPWTIYQHYGDLRIVERHWQAMCAWMHYIEEANPEHLWLNRRNNDFGDWLAQDGEDPANAFGSQTPKEVVATAYWAYDAQLMVQMANALERPDEARRYQALFEQVRSAFQRAFLEPGGWVQGRTQTGQVLALHFDLLPEGKREEALGHLVGLIESRGNHLTTGFIGVSYLCPVLTRGGRSDVAYRLLMQETFPSWLYSIRHGATTIWERWDGWTRDRGFQTPEMNSFNHYSLGSVGQWLYQHVAGLDTAQTEPAFKHVLVRPQLGGGLTHARAEYRSPRGVIRVAWVLEGEAISLDVQIPANTRATVTLPDGYATEVPLTGRADPGTLAGPETIEVGSGQHNFRARRHT